MRQLLLRPHRVATKTSFTHSAIVLLNVNSTVDRSRGTVPYDESNLFERTTVHCPSTKCIHFKPRPTPCCGPLHVKKCT